MWQTANTLVLLLDLLYLKRRKKKTQTLKNKRNQQKNTIATLTFSTSQTHGQVQKVKTATPVKTVRHIHHKDVPILHLLAAELNHWVTSFPL